MDELRWGAGAGRRWACQGQPVSGIVIIIIDCAVYCSFSELNI